MNKHPDDYVFGLDKDVQDKMRAKFDPERQDACQAWIEEVTGEEMGDTSFQEWLKSGVVLCILINKIKKKSVKKINKNKMAFKQMENIQNYNNACKKIGMRDGDCFVSQDLYEGDNLVAVIDQIYAIGALSRKVDGFEGPYFGVKFADEKHYMKADRLNFPAMTTFGLPQ